MIATNGGRMDSQSGIVPVTGPVAYSNAKPMIKSANIENSAVFLRFIGLKLSDKVSDIYNKGVRNLENLCLIKFFHIDIQPHSEIDEK